QGRFVMNAKLWPLSVLMLGQATVFASPPHRICDPSDPDAGRTVVSTAERERLGVRQKNWPGVVDPEVYKKLAALTKRIEEIKSVLRRTDGRDENAFQAMFSTHFEGTVCVQVILRPNKDNAEIERRVLRTLKGSEFYTVNLFNAVPAFVGYASRDGL